MKLGHRLSVIKRFGPQVPTLRHVLENMAFHDDDEGRLVFTSVATIVRETALGERTVQRALADLCACGWIVPELPPDRTDRYHGNAGGRTRSTRYRVVYRDTPTGTPSRRHRLTDKRANPVPTGNPVTVTRNPVTVTANPVTVTPQPRHGDGGSGMNRIDPGGSEGGATPLPHPPEEGAAAAPPPQAAGAAVPRPLPRPVLAAEAERAGCAMRDAGGEHWIDLLESIGCAYVSEVRSVVWQLTLAKRAEHPDSGMLPPFYVDHVRAYAPAVAAWLLTRRAEIAAAAATSTIAGRLKAAAAERTNPRRAS